MLATPDGTGDCPVPWAEPDHVEAGKRVGHTFLITRVLEAEPVSREERVVRVRSVEGSCPYVGRRVQVLGEPWDEHVFVTEVDMMMACHAADEVWQEHAEYMEANPSVWQTLPGAGRINARLPALKDRHLAVKDGKVLGPADGTAAARALAVACGVATPATLSVLVGNDVPTQVGLWTAVLGLWAALLSSTLWRSLSPWGDYVARRDWGSDDVVMECYRAGVCPFTGNTCWAAGLEQPSVGHTLGLPTRLLPDAEKATGLLRDPANRLMKVNEAGTHAELLSLPTFVSPLRGGTYIGAIILRGSRAERVRNERIRRRMKRGDNIDGLRVAGHDAGTQEESTATEELRSKGERRRGLRPRDFPALPHNADSQKQALEGRTLRGQLRSSCVTVVTVICSDRQTRRVDEGSSPIPFSGVIDIGRVCGRLYVRCVWGGGQAVLHKRRREWLAMSVRHVSMGAFVESWKTPKQPLVHADVTTPGVRGWQARAVHRHEAPQSVTLRGSRLNRIGVASFATQSPWVPDFINPEGEGLFTRTAASRQGIPDEALEHVGLEQRGEEPWDTREVFRLVVLEPEPVPPERVQQAIEAAD
mmetsp:Transcript_17975/g.41566  ORF Transcript_17975/g.41566 Transcript_17975/m.41566 type:complete len:588 (-) Transcript_17975:359-2122(-)